MYSQALHQQPHAVSFESQIKPEQEIDRHRINYGLDQTKYSEVFHATDLDSGKEVAMKFPNRRTPMQSIIREHDFHGRLADHEGVVGLGRHNFDIATPYMSTVFMPGGTLFKKYSKTPVQDNPITRAIDALDKYEASLDVFDFDKFEVIEFDTNRLYTDRRVINELIAPEINNLLSKYGEIDIEKLADVTTKMPAIEGYVFESKRATALNLARTALRSNALSSIKEVPGKNDIAKNCKIYARMAYVAMRAQQAGITAICDLKPENVFLDKYGITHVGDFGAASEVTPGTQVDRVPGTVKTMPPEAYMGMINRSFDVFSIGAIAYTKLGGRNAWKLSEENHVQNYAEIRRNKPIHLSRLNNDVSGDLGDFINQTLSFDPSMRPTNEEAAERFSMFAKQYRAQS